MLRWQTIIRQHPWLRRAGEWGFLFLVLLLALWGATQQRETPQLILLLFLYIVTVHFALPASFSSLSLMPVVALCSLLISEWQTAVFLLIISLVFSELLRPLWHPIWENINLSQPSQLERLGMGIRQLVALVGSFFAYQLVGGHIPSNLNELTPLLVLSGSHGLLFLLLSLPLWRGTKRPFSQFWREQSAGVLAIGTLGAPFAVVGSSLFWSNSMPAFVIYCLGIMITNIFLWLMWQRRYTLDQYVAQFAALNSVGTSLRETLDLPTVLQRTQQQVADLIPATHFTLWLRNDDGTWQTAKQAKQPIDDLTQWVAAKRRLLELNSRNLHFASQHGLAIPQPPPTAWLGVPLLTADQLLGVMVVQRFGNSQRFSRWTRELFLAIANQASGAIQNARLYGETLRLYNLTDEALAQRLRQLQALLNSIQDGVLMLNREGEIVLINPMAHTLLATASTQGVLTIELAPRLGYQAGEWRRLQQQLQTGSVEPYAAVRYPISLDSQTHTIERSGAPVLTEDQQILGWLMVFRDVTTEQELAQRRTDLTDMIVHDLRNPITTIISNLNLTSRYLEPPAAHDLLTDARQACHDMLDMVDSLLDISRMEAGQAVVDPEAMNLARLAGQVVERLQPLAQRQSVELQLEPMEQVPAVWADEEMLRRVLINLLDNGLKFTPNGGQVVCRVLAETAVSAHHEPGARCEISDTGPGIPAAARELIFDRYMRTNQGGAQIRGTGLGLTFCKMVVEAHNGRIWVEEAENGGSKFVFTLPGIPIFQES